MVRLWEIPALHFVHLEHRVPFVNSDMCIIIYKLIRLDEIMYICLFFNDNYEQQYDARQNLMLEIKIYN